MLSKFQKGIVLSLIVILALSACAWEGRCSWWLIASPLVVFIAWSAYGASVMSANFFIKSICKAPSNSNAIAVTFDDGPLPGHTDVVLDILRQYQVKAVFFCIGKNLAAHPILAKRIVDEGHLIANHSYYHKAWFSLQSTSKIEAELRNTQLEIEKIAGYKSTWFRPPYGVLNPMIAKAIERCGLKSIGWSLRSFDTQMANSEALLSRVTKRLKAGDVVLFHDSGKRTAEVLPQFFDHAKNCGLKIERADLLLKESAF